MAVRPPSASADAGRDRPEPGNGQPGREQEAGVGGASARLGRGDAEAGVPEGRSRREYERQRVTATFFRQVPHIARRG